MINTGGNEIVGAPYANRLYHRCDCVYDTIKYVRRTISEGNSANWSAEFILRHQSTAENVHDHFEHKESKVGYNY